MMFLKVKNGGKLKSKLNNGDGFTLVEVLVAGMIMIILAVGLLTVFSNVVQRNRGENLRMQALSALQKQVEYYRGLKFIPVGSDTLLDEGNFPNRTTETSEDGRVFNISVAIVNLPSGTADADCKFKEITIEAAPQTAETGWLADLKTNVTIQRVRSN